MPKYAGRSFTYCVFPRVHKNYVMVFEAYEIYEKENVTVESDSDE